MSNKGSLKKDMNQKLKDSEKLKDDYIRGIIQIYPHLNADSYCYNATRRGGVLSALCVTFKFKDNLKDVGLRTGEANMGVEYSEKLKDDYTRGIIQIYPYPKTISYCYNATRKGESCQRCA